MARVLWIRDLVGQQLCGSGTTSVIISPSHFYTDSAQDYALFGFGQIGVQDASRNVEAKLYDAGSGLRVAQTRMEPTNVSEQWGFAGMYSFAGGDTTKVIYLQIVNS